MMNNNGLQEREILDVIRILASQGASGRLHISTGMTEGALFFSRGQLVDARLGKLSGFQAINALVSVPDASYDFDPKLAPPVQSSIAPNERLLLKDFFGIEVADGEHANDVAARWLENDSTPERVAPLADVAGAYADEQHSESDADDEATLVRPKPRAAEPRTEPVVAVPTPEPLFAEPRFEPLVAEPRREPANAEHRLERPVAYQRRPPLRHQSAAGSRFVPALLLILVAALMAAAAVALLYRFRKPDSTASVAPTVQSPPRADVAQQPDTQTTQQSDTQATQQPQPTAVVPNLTGNWQVINTVEQTSYEPYRNMEIGFNVAINQAGRDFTGTGEKTSENGRSLPAAGRTAISVKGTIDGDRIDATFSENGAVRKTNGHFVWRIDRGSGGLTGTFVSTAARTRGKSAAKKVL